MQKFLYSFLVLSFFSLTGHASDCFNGRYLQPIFSQVDITKNIKYARKPQSEGQMIDLRYDVYEPHGDTLSLRPVMLLIHGGAYLKLIDQNSPDIVQMCEYFAKRGYVCVSIDYRQEPNVLALLSEESMVKAVGRALIDTKEAVDHLIGTYQTGNPYRIDTSKAFIGGVSAGAVSTMFISYLDSLQMLPPKYQQWIVSAVGSDADYVLRHKFDLVKPKVAISISGALLDTNWVINKGIDLFLNHGSDDGIVPYNFGNPLGIPFLPKLFGGKAIFPRAQHQGIRVEFEDWIGRGHVPFMNLSFPDILINLINPTIFDSTMRNIARFVYPKLECNSLISSVQHLQKEELKLFPNPSTGSFNIQMPVNVTTQEWKVLIYDMSGKEVQNLQYPGNTDLIQINNPLPPGIYFIKMEYEKNNETFVYTGKVTVIP